MEKVPKNVKTIDILGTLFYFIINFVYKIKYIIYYLIFLYLLGKV